MPKILILGSGYVARPCIETLLLRPDNEITIASRTLNNAQQLAKSLCFPNTTTTDSNKEETTKSRVKAIAIDVTSPSELEEVVSNSNYAVIISLIPYTHHPLVIQIALKHKVHVITTSYISPLMHQYHQEAIQQGVTVMNEIGLDPGIDHLYAIKTIDRIHKEGGVLKGFVSYCGGLPTPENSNNPLGYKFSWSSRGVLLALTNTASYIKNNQTITVKGGELMRTVEKVYTGYCGFGFLGYPNRDSTVYRERYGVPECETVIRGTLRYDGFPQFVHVLVSIGLLDTSEKEFIQEGMTWRMLICRLLNTEEGVSDEQLIDVILEKSNALQWEESKKYHIINGIRYFELLSTNQIELPNQRSPLDVLCLLLEKKLKYQEGERDMIFLQHRFQYLTREKEKRTITSTLLEYGDPICSPSGSSTTNKGWSAMSKTVGVPCAIATQLILDGEIRERGVLAPMTMDVCGPILRELEKFGIVMQEVESEGW